MGNIAHRTENEKQALVRAFNEPPPPIDKEKLVKELKQAVRRASRKSRQSTNKPATA